MEPLGDEFNMKFDSVVADGCLVELGCYKATFECPELGRYKIAKTKFIEIQTIAPSSGVIFSSKNGESIK